jgi:hypothetical protein
MEMGGGKGLGDRLVAVTLRLRKETLTVVNRSLIA